MRPYGTRRACRVPGCWNLSIVYTIDCSDQNSFPFGGKQLILVGEFLQLRPVPGRFDSGELMFFSPVFQWAIAHRIQLKQVMRQTFGEDEFSKALQEVRMGECSLESYHYLKTLSRDLNTDTVVVTHISFRHEEVFLHNRDVLDKMPGNSVILRGNLVEETEHFKFSGEAVLTLKEGCQVLLVWNLTVTLKNGSRGTFVAMSNGKAMVHFKNEGVIHIDKQTWTNHSMTGQKVGKVTKYPIILAYAVTCHKSQGLELPYVVLHCSSEFVSGLTYVGMSRTKSYKHLQLIKFRPEYLMKPPEDVIQLCSSSCIGKCIDNLSCCRRKVNVDAFLTTIERPSCRCGVNYKGQKRKNFSVQSRSKSKHTHTKKILFTLRLLE